MTTEQELALRELVKKSVIKINNLNVARIYSQRLNDPIGKITRASYDYDDSLEDILRFLRSVFNL